MLVAVQTNAQAIDLVRAMANRLAAAGSTDVFGFWPSGAAKNEYEAEINWLRGHPNVDVCEKSVDANNGPDVVVAVARKWAFHNASSRPFLAITRRFDIGVVDEAFQMRAAELMRFGDLVVQVVLVGDPGQLEPFTPIDSERWLGLEASPLTPSPDAVRAFLGGSAVNSFALPASFRLDHRAAPVVSECFYPRLSFDAEISPRMGEPGWWRFPWRMFGMWMPSIGSSMR